MKLLIVDDHILFREGLAAIIRPERDFEIAGLAGTVKEAVEMAETIQPDMILMDFALPDETGADATRQILETHPKCKIVFLTMSDEDENLLEAIRSGAKGYLLKDVSVDELINAARLALEGKASVDDLRQGRLDSGTRAAVGGAAVRLRDIPLSIRPLLLDFEEVRAAAEMVPPRALLLVDSLQLMPPPRPAPRL